MTVQLTTNITQPNIARWRVIAFDVARGQATIRVGSGGEAQWVDLVCILSDTLNGSMGIGVNPSPLSWNDKIINIGTPPGPNGVGVGAANSLTNAQNAYRGAGSNAAGLKAVELQALTDGWVSAALTGT